MSLHRIVVTFYISKMSNTLQIKNILPTVILNIVSEYTL